MKKLVYFLLFAVISINLSAFDYELKSAVKHPTKNEIFIAGTFNTMLVIDSETGKTIKTFAVEEPLSKICFTKSQNHILGLGTSGVYQINPETGETTAFFKGFGFKIHDFSPYFTEIKAWGETAVNIYDSETGSIFKEIKTDFQPYLCVFDNSFENIYVISSKIEMPNEKDFLSAEIQKSESYNTYNSAYTKKQEDGSGSIIKMYNIETGEVVRTINCPFDFAGRFSFTFLPLDDKLIIADWDGVFSIDNNGITTAIESEFATFAYASAYSNDKNNICIASTKSGSLFNIENNTWKEFDVKDNYEFAYTADIFSLENNFWLLSKDYSLICIDINGNKLKSFKINDAGEEGFNVYYTNGYSKKEDRDKEAAIINSLLTQKSLPLIDLEENLDVKKVVIANFKTSAEAIKFIEELKDNKLQYLTLVAPADRLKSE